MSTTAQSLHQTAINTIRTLAMDAVEAAGCGHPGTSMAMAPVAYQLWREHLRYDPAAPLWPNRDRYVLSCGHASMLLYSLIHLAGIRHVKSDGTVTDEPALSLDGHLKLSNLCWIYDDNQITIEGRTELAFSEDVATRFRGLGWHVVPVGDANDLKAIESAYRRFLAYKD